MTGRRKRRPPRWPSRHRVACDRPPRMPVNGLLVDRDADRIAQVPVLG